MDNAKPLKKRRRRKRKKVNRTSSHRHKRTLIKGTLPRVEDLSMDNMSRTVFNLTDKELTKEQLYVFFLSHKFAPTPPLPDLSGFENDLCTWFSKMRAKVVFDSFKCGPNQADKGLLTWSAAFLRPHHHVPLNHVKTLHSRHLLNAAEQKLISTGQFRNMFHQTTSLHLSDQLSKK